MGNESLIIFILGILIGSGVAYILFVKFKLGKKIIEIKQKKILESPEKLKELLEKNGEVIDDGKVLFYKIEKDGEGKDILKQEISELPKTNKKKKPDKKATRKKTKSKKPNKRKPKKGKKK